MCCLKPFVVFTLFRTWANGWTTSHRMHDPYLYKCILGCPDGQDSLTHYVQCNRLWKAVKTGLSRTSSPVPHSMVSACVLDRLAISSPTSDRFMHLCAVTHAYHTLRHNYRQFFYTDIIRGDTAHVATVTIDVLTAAILPFRSMI